MEDAIVAVREFELAVGPGQLKLAYFRGYEAMQSPDLKEVLEKGMLIHHYPTNPSGN